MDINIEDGFRPTTAVEIALLNRINDLKRAILIGRSWDPMTPGSSDAPLLLDSLPNTITLHRAALAEVDVDERGIRLRAEAGRGDRKLGVARYMSEMDIVHMGAADVVRYLDEVHKDVIHRLAKILTDEKAKAKRNNFRAEAGFEPLP